MQEDTTVETKRKNMNKGTKEQKNNHGKQQKEYLERRKSEGAIAGCKRRAKVVLPPPEMGIEAVRS